MGTISDTVGANQGNLDAAAGQIRGFLPGLGERAFGDNPGLNAAMGYATDSINGKYLDQQNPYLQGMIDQTGNDVMNRTNNLAARSGASLGTQHFGIASRELANAENSLRYGNYAQERQNQQSAAGMMPALNQSQYAGVMPYLAAQQTAAGLPFTGIQNLGAIGGLAGGYGTQTGTQPGGWGQALLSGGMAALPFIPGISAREAKTKIERIGEWDERGDGLGKYRFAYRWAPDEMLEGVMADEVAALRPKALGPIMRGYHSVNYAMLEAA